MKLLEHLYFGGDYCPEQWDEATLEKDIQLFRKAGINLLTLPVFAWVRLEPQEGVYAFDWLDHILDTMHQNGIRANLATPTAAQPAWLSRRYPEVLPVDIAGRKRTHGMRVFFCYNSVKYRERAAAIAQAMAERYRTHPALAVWHVANEYGTYCYCEHCQQLFRQWLQARYGTLDELNKRWHTVFWGRTFTDWEEIMLPTELNDDYRFNPTIQLDYLRFVTASTRDCLLNECNAIRRFDKETPIQTNMSGFIKKLDQFEMAKHMDIVGWDNYPSPRHEPSLVAMKHDIMRGLKDGQSFMLSEQSPNQQNWQSYNKLKRPGEVRRLSYQAIAHGADTCLFFQMRQSIAGQEKFHGAVISHAGTDQTRIFKEIAQLGKELPALDGVLQARSQAQVGMLFDWSNWWALENSSGPSCDIDYIETMHSYYKAFYDCNIAVDILGHHRSFAQYRVIVAPMAYMVTTDLAQRLSTFVESGGVLIGTVLTGVADENDRCVFGEYPGLLRRVFGLRVEETDALLPDERNEVLLTDGSRFSCGMLCDVMITYTAAVLGRYTRDFYQGSPCVTQNAYGKGTAYYVGTRPEQALLNWLVKRLDLAPVCAADSGVETTLRTNKNGEYLFCINHNDTASTVWPNQSKTWLDILAQVPVQNTLKIVPGDVRILWSDH